MTVARSAARVLDEFLVVSAQAGDRKAFALLAERWHGKLAAHAWRLTGDRELALDAAQAAWIDIVRGLGRLRDPRAFPAWAYRIVSRRCAGQIGEAVRRRELAAAMASEPAESDAGAEGAAGVDGLRTAIALLPPGQRSALALFYLEEMSVAEVAVALDVPLGTVKTRLMHARRKLREAMESEGGNDA